VGIIKNVVETLFTSNGAAKVIKDTDSMGRAQTRLGQASASNSRAFAAQSQGLGGLVAAYAGAAATVFALQAAFTALAKAAQAETIVRGTSTLAAMTSQSGPRIISTIQGITDNQLTLTEAAQNANIALSAGFNSDQIEQFATIAQKASQALGRDFTDSLQRIVRGISKLEPELLDELGIFTRIEPAVQAYARQLGLSASSLTEFQRRQAFANAAIEEGTRKFGVIDTSSTSLQKTLEQLRVKISELGTGFLQVVASAIAPFLSFLTNDLGNAVLAFGFLLSLVFGKTTEVIGGFVGKTGHQLSGWADTIADKSKLAVDEVQKLQKAVSAPVKGGAGGLGGIRTKALVGQDPAQAKRFEQALELQKQSANLLPSQLNKINESYKEQIATLKTLGRDGSQSFQNLTAAVARNEAVINKAGRRITLFIGLSNSLRGAASLLTKGFAMLGSVINSLFMVISVVQLVGTIFDIDLLGNFINMFKDMSKATQEVTTGFNSLAVAASGGGAALSKSLKLAGATEADIEGFKDRVTSLREEIEAAATTEIRTGKAYSLIPANTETRIQAVTDAIAKSKTIVATGPGTGLFDYSQEDIEQARIDIIAYNSILQVLKDNTEPAARVITQLADATGLAGEQIAKLLTPEIMKGTEQLTLFGVAIEKIDGKFSLENATQQQMKYLEAVVLSKNGVMDFNDAVTSGNISVNTAGAAIAGLESQLLELKNYYNLVNSTAQSPIEQRAAEAALTAIDGQIAALETDLDIFRQVESALIAREKTYKDITSTFSKELSLLDNAEVTGILDSYGNIATTQEQINQNQADYLKNILQATAYAKELVGSEEAINKYIKDNNLSAADAAVLQATIAKDADNYDKALGAVQGKLIDITKQLNDFTTSVKDAIKELDVELADLRLQDTLSELRFKIDMADIAAQGTQAAFEFEKAFKENQIKLVELQVENEKIDPITGAGQINDLKAEIQSITEASIAAEKQAAQQKLLDEGALRAKEYLATQERIKLEAEQLKAKFKAEYEVLKAAASTYAAISTQMSTALVTAGNSIGQAIVTAANAGARVFASAFGPIGKLLGIGSGIQEASFTPQAMPTAATTVQTPAGPQTVDSSPITAAIAEADAAFATLGSSIEEAAATKAELAADEFNRVTALALAQYNFDMQALKNREDLTAQERAIMEEEAAKRLKEAADASGGGEDKLNELDKMIQALFDSIKGHISSALSALNDLIFYGEGDFNEIMSNMFKSIQQDFFKTTIADPLSTALTDNLFSMLGVGNMRTGIENAKVQNGALLVNIVNGPSELFGGVLGDKATTEDPTTKATGMFSGFFEQITSMFTGIFGQGGLLSKLFSGIFGQGGLLSGIFGGFGGSGGLFSSIFGGLFGMGAAQGGWVHLAQGGAASAALMRDRVPSMLEPGEFVLRKQSARKIGLPALQAMNATGNAGGNGNVSVNVVNEGSPKDAQASQPRFDGEKYVIDIVMRDLSNNGPIRRSLRSRGGL
jgi:hypothetical protein